MGFNKKILNIESLRNHYRNGTFDVLLTECEQADALIGCSDCMRMIELYRNGKEKKLKKLLFSK